jgi:hypothetical protein
MDPNSLKRKSGSWENQMFAEETLPQKEKHQNGKDNFHQGELCC